MGLRMKWSRVVTLFASFSTYDSWLGLLYRGRKGILNGHDRAACSGGSLIIHFSRLLA